MTTPDAVPEAGARLRAWLAAGQHGDMRWMADTADRRAEPRQLWPEVGSVIMLGMNYGPQTDPLAVLGRPQAGAISVYARHRDYHDVVKGKLKQLAAVLDGAEAKVFVDTAPVMEKPLAAAAGIGWMGKHTNLVSTEYGSWLFLGSIFTSLALEPDRPAEARCGSCRACLDICPTGAFPAPYRLDATRCISYLTIEHKGHIARALRPAIGNRIYGCDDCLAVCPWNKFAVVAREAKLTARPDLDGPPLDRLAGLDDGQFRAMFAGGPIKRIGIDRFLRNVLVAIGNSGRPELARRAAELACHPSPLVRAAAVWAGVRLLGREAFAARVPQAVWRDDDADVRSEWESA